MHTSHSSMSSNPSQSTQIKINPAAVPTDKGFGLEAILYKQDIDLMAAQGTGRMGAALSPSNAESTFFGPPSIESDPLFYDRHSRADKYKNQKLTLATAFELYDKQGSGFRRQELKLGILGKYNTLTKGVHPGAGLSGVLGPFSFGYSWYSDESKILYPDGYYYTPVEDQIVRFKVQTYNVGIYLRALTLDYANMRMQSETATEDVRNIQLYTANLNYRGFSFTLSKRFEQSYTPSYDYENETLNYARNKDETFGGIRYHLNKNFVVGGLYNYYLLHEFSINMLFFL